MFSPAEIRINRQKMGPNPRDYVVEGGNVVFSWALDTDTPEAGQRAFCLRILTQEGRELCSTGRIESAAQEYALDSALWPQGEMLTVSLAVEDANGQVGAAESALCIGDVEWTARWISADEDPGERAVYLRREFEVRKPVRAATLYACGIGYHNITINGAQPDNACLDPAFTDYTTDCHYAVIPDAHRLLCEETNCIGVVLGGGWRAAQFHTEEGMKYPRYHGKTQLILMLKIFYEDGTDETISTDGSWTWSYGPIVMNSLFGGETYDARLDMPYWNIAGYEGAFRPVAVAEGPGGQLRPMLIPPVRQMGFYSPIAISQAEKGKWIVDFGQNIAGVISIQIPEMEPGSKVVIRHAEVLDEDGSLYTAPLRSAACTDTYISGGTPDVWSPVFTYHGFRYAEVTGMRPTKLNIEAVQMFTDLEKDSSFRCGSALINAIQQNLIMTERDNMHSILTDCPQRDERMGWMNDATVRFEETPFNFDTGAMFRKIVRDLASEQQADGAISCTCPLGWFGKFPADPVCSSFLVAAWQNYLHNGDKETMKENFDAFAAWEKCLIAHSDDYIVNYSYYGDWAGPTYACLGLEGAQSAVTPGVFMSTGYSYYNCVLLSKMAHVLGRAQDQAEYEALAGKIKKALLDKWYDPEKAQVATGSEACQAFALWLGILPEEDRARAAKMMRDDLVGRDYRFTTGNLCTRYMMDMLSEYGYQDEAYELITREEYPSFGFMIQQEATTIWERFELKKHPGMNSHNHPMYGAVGSWLYTHLAGVRPTGAGFETVDIIPRIPKKLMSAQANLDTVRGPLNVKWVKRYGGVHLYVDLPAGVTANVVFGGKQTTLTAGSHHLEYPEE